MTSADEMSQRSAWNGASGNAWVDLQTQLDDMFKLFEELLVRDAVALQPRRVLDVGCGTGGVTRAVAKAIAAGNSSVGVDISQIMIDVARANAAREGVPATFIAADVQTYEFEDSAFDLVMSRFGVMFFDDPNAAFRNLRGACTPNGRLRFFAWRSAAENPFMTAAERAASSLMPLAPARETTAPGQFAFADRQHVSAILEAGGWSSIDVQPIDVLCTLPVSELELYVTRMGPVGRALQEASAPTRAAVVPVVLAEFQSFVHGDQVRFTAACWCVTACASQLLGK